MLEVSANNPIRLSRVWDDWFGVVPPLECEEGVSFVHFPVARGRALLLLRPDRAAISGGQIGMAAALVSTRHCCDVRLATEDDQPELPDPRPPAHDDVETVEVWPVVADHDEPCVLELGWAAGWFLADEFGALDTEARGTRNPDEAILFNGVAEAELFLAPLAHAPFVPRYLTAARSEFDQGQTAELNDRS
jgi:hypothetical protein